MSETGGDVTERDQDKSTCVVTRMGKCHERCFCFAVSVGQQIKIDGSRTPLDSPLAVKLFFNASEKVEELTRGQRSSNGDDAVEKGALFRPSHGLCLIQWRDRCDGKAGHGV